MSDSTSPESTVPASEVPAGAPPLGAEPHRDAGTARRVGRALSFRNASALYVFAAIFVLFSLWVPDTFLTATTWRTLLDSQAVTALVAVGLVLPLAAGVFDLSVGAAVGAGSMFVAWLLSKQGVPVGTSVALTVLAGLAIGLTNGLLIVAARIDSFIATLGMSSLLTAFVIWISNGEQIIGLSSAFTAISTNQLFGISYPVYMLIVVALVVWYVLERTPMGRRIYATGGNPEAARLSGVRTKRVVVTTLMACSALAAFGGGLVASRLGTGDPLVGPDYLLPAFGAAFLGATQFRGGRFNVWGTVVAVYVLATGVKGLQLAGAPVWLPYLFNGIALLVAVGLTQYTRVGRAAGRRWGRRAPEAAA